VTHRRDFLSAAAAVTGAAFGWPTLAPRVSAHATLFHANPDGAATLVRFTATGIAAPAARLRVYDGARRLLGTAGLIRSGEALLGELWIRFEGGITIASELEAPGLRGVHRTSHPLRQRPRWTVYWVPVADSERLLRELEALPPLTRLTQGAVYRISGVSGNPLVRPTNRDLDHLQHLTAARAAGRLEREFGVPASAMAVTRTAQDEAAIAATQVLAGSGVRFVARPALQEPHYEWWEARDGSRVLAVPIPAGGNARSLGLSEGAFTMVPRVESWLESEPLHTAWRVVPNRRTGVSIEERTTVVVETEPDESVTRMRSAIDEWNRRYAFPRFAPGSPADLQRLMGNGRSANIPVIRPRPETGIAVPSAAELQDRALLREKRASERLDQLFDPLANLLPGDDRGLAAVAASVATEFAGTVIFNPSPFLRTDVVTLPDGHERLVTDVPPLGYAYLVTLDGTPRNGPQPAPGEPLDLSTAEFAIELDPRSGAITSLVSRGNGIEWVRAGSDGLNALPGAILEGAHVELLPGIGRRLVADRWSPEFGEVRTTVTAYETLPWIDIVNHARVVGEGPITLLFPFDMPDAEVRWEVPGGFEALMAPVERAAHLRWVHVRTATRNVFFRSLDAPHFSVQSDGLLASFGPRGRSRYRIAADTLPATLTDAARFGWRAEPLVAVSTPGRPDGRLPRHGSLLGLDEPGAVIVGVEPSPRREGLVAYVQDLLGAGRVVTLAPGLLAFHTARRVDYLGRPVEDEAMPVPGGPRVRLSGYGIAAVELSGLSLGVE
jgi:hypothetical protein